MFYNNVTNWEQESIIMLSKIIATSREGNCFIYIYIYIYI